MDILEKLNKGFGNWYESWFGDAVSDIRPKDVLRKIISAMEDNRKEGLDSRIYVPNKYVLEIAFDSEEEREYLLAFLEKDELESALRKYMGQHKYYIRGPLDFTMEEVIPEDDQPKPEKLKVKCRWDVRHMERDAESHAPDAPQDAVPGKPYEPYEEEEYTVAQTDVYDAGTVAPPTLQVRYGDGNRKDFLLVKPVITIGRSHRLGNDLVIESDGMVSKRHARIAACPEGYAISDLDSTNGVWVNDERVSGSDTRVLRNGDVIRLGATEILFQDTAERPAAVAASMAGTPHPRLVYRDPIRGEDDFPLASEAIIGRSLSSGLRIDHSSVSRQHARIFTEDGSDYYVEDMGSATGTAVNGVPVTQGDRMRLRSGDRIRLGDMEVRFEIG